MADPAKFERTDERQKWEWSADEIKRVGYRVVDLIAGHLANLPKQPVFRPFPKEDAARYLASKVPEAGESVDEILNIFEREIAPFPFGNGHPRFYGWVNSPPVVIGIFAEALAAAMNPSCAGGNHAAVYVEREVINWFKQMVRFPSEAMGLLVSGGSMAALTALAVARHVKCGFDIRARGLQATPERLVFYRTQETHGCHQKAIELLGIGREHFRIVPHNEALEMDTAALDESIEDDIRHGLKPIAVVATAGTVNTGAIDPLDRIADVCERHKVWLHVDGAYGIPAILSGQYRRALAAISRADSLALDPHKWLYVPVEAGVVLVRNSEAMRAAFSLVPPYLRTDGQVEGVGGLPWFSEYGYQQTRGFRALKIWMSLRCHGLSGYREAIEHDIALAQCLASEIRASRDFELREPQNLSVVCFRYVPRDRNLGPQELDSLNKTLLEKLQLGGSVFLSSTVLDGRFWLRACVLNPRAQEHDVKSILQITRDTAQSGIA